MSLNKGRMNSEFDLSHENQLDPLFKKIPALLEFRNEKYKDPSLNKTDKQPAKRHLPAHYTDRQGNEYGRK